MCGCIGDKESYVAFLTHRNNLVGNVVLVELLHVRKQLVGVGQEGLFRSTEPVVDLSAQGNGEGTFVSQHQTCAFCHENTFGQEGPGGMQENNTIPSYGR